MTYEGALKKTCLNRIIFKLFHPTFAILKKMPG
jgi:hypothetical protein